MRFATPVLNLYEVGSRATVMPFAEIALAGAELDKSYLWQHAEGRQGGFRSLNGYLKH